MDQLFGDDQTLNAFFGTLSRSWLRSQTSRARRNEWRSSGLRWNSTLDQTCKLSKDIQRTSNIKEQSLVQYLSIAKRKQVYESIVSSIDESKIDDVWCPLYGSLWPVEFERILRIFCRHGRALFATKPRLCVRGPGGGHPVAQLGHEVGLATWREKGLERFLFPMFFLFYSYQIFEDDPFRDLFPNSVS